MKPVDASLSDDELDELQRFFQQDHLRDRAMNVAALEGYSAAVIIAPHLVPPSRWLPWVWDTEQGTEPADFASEQEAQRIINLVIRLYNGVAVAFTAKTVEFKPLYQRAARWDARNWCSGFLLGLDFAESAWLALMDEQPAWFTPFVLLGEDEEIPPEEYESGNVERWMQAIPTRLVQMRDHWRRHPPSEHSAFDDDGFEAEVPQTFIREAPKVGRNEACPCGSGKKFKKCCGKPPTLH
jgi:uncharacterized protein